MWEFVERKIAIYFVAFINVSASKSVNIHVSIHGKHNDQNSCRYAVFFLIATGKNLRLCLCMKEKILFPSKTKSTNKYMKYDKEIFCC